LYVEFGNPTLRRCSLIGNFASYGGAIHNNGGNLALVDCLLAGNAAAGWGGAIDNFSATATLINSVLVGNTATGEGGAIHNDFSTLTLTNCTLSANSAGNRGGGLLNYAGVLVMLTNGIVWGNRDGSGGGEPAQIFNNPGNAVVVNHTCLEGLTGSFGGVGNLADDPLFQRDPTPGPDGLWNGVDDDYGDLHLRGASQSLDAGDNDADTDAQAPGVQPMPGFDYDGNTRIANGIVDLGAFERQATAIDVRIATWNIDSVGEPGTVQYDAALAILNRIGADVVAVNEVGSPADVTNFQDLALDAGYPFTVVPSSNPFGEARIAFMSKFPFAEPPLIHTSASLSGDPIANDITRLIVEIVVDLPDNPLDLTLVVNHWKSGAGNDHEFRRAVESFRVSQAVGISEWFVITGNVNEEIDSVPRSPSPFTKMPPGLPSSYILGTDLQAELAGQGIVNDPFFYLDPAFALPAFQLDGSDATQPPSGRRLDYIFVSDAVLQQIPQTEVYDSNDEGLQGGLFKFGNPLPASTSLDAAEHLPVFMDVTLVPGGCSTDVDCDDGFFCNGPETCDIGTETCIPGTSIDCDDGNSCTIDSCDETLNMCQHSTPPSPGEVFSLMVGKMNLSWDPEAVATGYDIVRGDLLVLHGTKGDFTAATSICLADDNPGIALSDPEMPIAGQGFWYIVRAGLCGVNGTYDTGTASQVESRDGEINASTFSCP
jgi:exonuclease III